MAALDRFSPVARAWFESAFEAPTDAQDQGWEAISRGDHTLILAPTGSGKTLAAFLWALDRLVTRAAAGRRQAPAAGALRLARSRPSPTTSSATCGRPWPAWPWRPSGGACPCPTCGSASAPATRRQSDRRDIVRHPPDILVTTPESLYLMLTSQAREVLRSVEYVIVDEIHSVAGHQAGRPPGPVAGAAGAAAPDAAARSASACRPPSARSTRWPASSAAGADRRPASGAPGRWRWSTPGCASSWSWRSSCPVEDMGELGKVIRRRAASGPAAGDPEVRTLDLAGHPPRPARPHPHPHVHPDLRELPPAGRAAGGPAQRPGRRGAGAGPPRLDRPGAAARDRGRSSRRASCRRWWPRRAWSWASTWAPSTWWCRWRRRRRWPAACSASAGPATRWAQPSRGQDLPQVPGRPGGGGGRRAADGAAG